MSISSVLFSGLIVGLLVTNATAEYPREDLLIEPAQLASTDAANKVVVLDVREPSKYNAGHIPSARWVDHAEWSKGFGDGDDISGWTKRLGELGLETTSKVVVYDDNFAKDAARVWWILRYWGLNDVRLLNGGWRGWQNDKFPIETQSSPITATQPAIKPMAKRFASKSDLLSSLTNGTLQIVDARSEAEFCGVETLNNKRAGAIPGAKQLEWSDLIDKETRRFKSAAELSRLFATAGIDLARPTATHCQSGGRASVMAFGLELMGAKEVSNYYRSWSEWGNSDDTPIVPGNASESGISQE